MQSIHRQEMILIVIAVFVMSTLFAAFFLEDVDKTLAIVLALAAAFYFLIAVALSLRLMNQKKKLEEAFAEEESHAENLADGTLRDRGSDDQGPKAP